MKITLTDDEVKETLVAIKVMGATYTALLSMATTKETRQLFLDPLLRLANIERKLS